MDQIRNGPFINRCSQLCGAYLLLQPKSDLSIRCRREDVPGLAFAARQPDGAREAVVWVHLNRERCSGEKELQQERRFRGLWVGSPEPQLADGGTAVMMRIPGPQIRASPRLGHRSCQASFDGHRGFS